MVSKILAELDNIYEEIERRFNRIKIIDDEEEKIRTKISKIKEDMAKIKERSKEVEEKYKEIEKEIKEEEKRIKILEMRAKEILNPRIQMAIEEEIKEAKRVKTKFEDEALKIIEEKERIDEEIKRMEEELKEIEKEAEKIFEQRRKEKEMYIQEIEELKRKEQEKEEELKKYPGIFEKYKEILKKANGGRPIARFENGICRKCHIVLPPEVETKLYSDEFVTCMNCGAILFIPETD